MSTTTKALLIVGLVILFVLAARSIGCSPFPGELGTKDNPDVSKSGVTIVKEATQPGVVDGLPTRPAPLKWWDTGLSGTAFHAASWMGKQYIWVQDGEKMSRHVLGRISVPGWEKIVVSKTDPVPGKSYAVASHNDWLVRIFQEGTSVALQYAKKTDADALKWYTLRTFPASVKTPPSQIGFLGNAALFFDKEEIYAINPHKKDAPETFPLPFKVYPGVNHMKCGDGYCIGLYGGRFPLVFAGDWDWKAIPGSARWQAVSTHVNPYSNESESDKKAADKAITTKIEQKVLTPSDRLAFVGNQVAFLMRDTHLFWTCHLKNQIFGVKSGADAVTALSWAGEDLLLLTKKKVFVQYDKGKLAMLLPEELQKSTNEVELHSVRYENGMLLLEASTKKSKKRRLFAAVYKNWPGYAICK